MDTSEREPAPGGVSRRRFIGYLLAGPTLIAGAQLGVSHASAAIPTIQPVDAYDLSDLLTDAAMPTSGLIRVIVNSDGTASFALPRAEVGQGITTAVAMTIADELDLPLDRIKITLADAEPALVFNQLTGGSNSMHALYTPVRIAAAAARGHLVHAAARSLDVTRSSLTVRDGKVIAADGRAVNFGDLAKDAAVTESRAVHAHLKATSQHNLVGTSQGRIDAHQIVTGTKVFAMDLDVPGAMPTMVCRPPTINGTALAVSNRGQVEKMLR